LGSDGVSEGLPSACWGWAWAEDAAWASVRRRARKITRPLVSRLARARNANAGLGWGFGAAVGSQYIDLSPEFNEARTHRPNPIQQVKYAVRRLVTLGAPPKEQ